MKVLVSPVGQKRNQAPAKKLEALAPAPEAPPLDFFLSLEYDKGAKAGAEEEESTEDNLEDVGKTRLSLAKSLKDTRASLKVSESNTLSAVKAHSCNVCLAVSDR